MSWPASVTRDAAEDGAAIRWPIISTAWLATTRPKRASQPFAADALAAGTGSP